VKPASVSSATLASGSRRNSSASAARSPNRAMNSSVTTDSTLGHVGMAEVTILFSMVALSTVAGICSATIG
jgi:hypothetical protein